MGVVDRLSAGTARFGVRPRLAAAGRVLVHANLVIGTAAAGVALTTVAVANLPREPLPVLFVFVAAWFAYTANRFTDRLEDAQNLPERTAFIEQMGRPLLVATGAGYVALLVIVSMTHPRMLPVAVLPVLGIVVYASGQAKRYFLVKNGLVGGMWAGVPIGMGLFYHGTITAAVGLLALVVFGQITLAAALFDIKDIPGDRAIGSRTLPVLVGADGTRLAVVAGAVLLSIPIGWAAVTIAPAFTLLFVYPVHLIGAALLARPDRGPLFYGLAIDGEHVLVGGLALLLS